MLPSGTRVSGEDIICGKTVTLPDDPTGAVQRFTKKDASLALRGHEAGVIDQVRGTRDDEGRSQTREVPDCWSDVFMCWGAVWWSARITALFTWVVSGKKSKDSLIRC